MGPLPAPHSGSPQKTSALTRTSRFCTDPCKPLPLTTPSPPSVDVHLHAHTCCVSYHTLIFSHAFHSCERDCMPATCLHLGECAFLLLIIRSTKQLSSFTGMYPLPMRSTSTMNKEGVSEWQSEGRHKPTFFQFVLHFERARGEPVPIASCGTATSGSATPFFDRSHRVQKNDPVCFRFVLFWR